MLAGCVKLAVLPSLCSVPLHSLTRIGLSWESPFWKPSRESISSKLRVWTVLLIPFMIPFCVYLATTVCLGEAYFACAWSARPGPLTPLAQYELQCAEAPQTAMLPPVLLHSLQPTAPIVFIHRAHCSIFFPPASFTVRGHPCILSSNYFSRRLPPLCVVSAARCVPSSRPSSLSPPSVGCGHGRFAGAADHPPGTARG